MPVDIGAIACQTIATVNIRSYSRLIFPALITNLLTAASVPCLPTDVISISKTLMDQGTVIRMHKPHPTADNLVDDASGPVHATTTPPRSRPLPRDVPGPSFPPTTETPIPPIPPTRFTYGSEAWLACLATQMEEMNQRMTTILDTVVDLNGRVVRLDDRVADLEARTVKFWIYYRDRARVTTKFYYASNPMLANQLPRFPAGLCPPQVRLPPVVSTPYAPAAAAEQPSTSHPDERGVMN